MRTKTANITEAGHAPSPNVEIKLGLDVHLAYVTVSVMSGQSVPKRPVNWRRPELLQRVGQWVRAGRRVHCVQEAGPFGFVLHRQLEEAGARSLVMAPVALDAKGGRRKSDKRDALAMVRALNSHLLGDSKAITVVRVPSEEQEQRRGLSRLREQILADRKRAVMRGVSYLMTQGVPAPKGWWQAQGWPALRERLRPEQERVLGHWAQEARRLDQREREVRAQVLALGQSREQGQPATSPRPKGYGQLTDTVLSLEIGDWSRFQGRRGVASFTGLCPGIRQSGGRRIEGSVDKYGHPTLRRLLVEAVWRMLRWQPHYRPIQRILQIPREQRRARLKAVVAAARQLAIDMWRLQTGRTTLERLGLQPA